jgi:hypothetical protein
MRFTSLVVELIRARPRLVVWIVVLCQAALWLTVSLIFYRSPPGEVATVLAYGREYQVGTDLGPPLSFWLADIAYRVAGNHVLGVYVLAQLCAIVTFWALYLLARARGALDHDGHRVRFVRARIRTLGGDQADLGAAAAA